MKYMGSKNRIAKHILPIILKDRKDDQWYVEPMVGGANLIDKVEGNRIGNDINKYVISLLIEVQKGYIPEKITKEEYKQIKDNQYNYPEHIIGWVGIGCSYSGKWFGGYAGEYRKIRNYQQETINSLLKQKRQLEGVIFLSKNYFEIEYPENSIIYCDPPYEGTTKYKDGFNHSEFWEWCRNKSKKGHSVFVSEYKAPEDFKCVWQKNISSSLSANGKIGGNKISTEKLFIYNPNKTNNFNENLDF